MIDSFHTYPLFPDLLENQKQSVHFFWEKGILDELELFSFLSRSPDRSQNAGIQLIQRDTFLEDEKELSTKSFRSNNPTPVHLTPLAFRSEPLRNLVERGSDQKTRNSSSFQTSEDHIHLALDVRFSKRFGFDVRERVMALKKTKRMKRGQNPVQTSLLSSLMTPVRTLNNESWLVRMQNPTAFGRSKRTRMTNGTTLPQTYHSFIKKIAGHKANAPHSLFNRPGAQKVSMMNAGKDPPSPPSGAMQPRPTQRTFVKVFGKPGENTLRESENERVSPARLFIHGSKFLLKAPRYSQRDALRFQKTYSVGLYLPIEFCTGYNEEGAGIQRHPRHSPGMTPRPKVSTRFAEIASDPQASNPQSREVHHAHVESWMNTQTDLRASKKESSFLQWVYFGEIPLMTERGSFLINGSPRVLVNQIVRCPSVYFKLKLDAKNRRTYIASFLAEYGSWLRLETDHVRSQIWVRIDKSPRFPLELLLSALGWGLQSKAGGSKLLTPKLSRYPDSGQNPFVPSKPERSAHSPEMTPRTQVLRPVPANGVRTQSGLRASSGSARRLPGSHPASHIQNAIDTIWRKCNPTRWTSALGSYTFFYMKFFHPRRYSLGTVGRVRLNKRLGRKNDCEIPTLTPEDIFLALDYLVHLQNGKGSSSYSVDDIDHLKNRRVRLPGEILQNQFRLAFSRVAGVVQSSLNKTGLEGMVPSSQSLSDGQTNAFPKASPAFAQAPGSARGPDDTSSPSLFETPGGRTPVKQTGRNLAQIFGGSPPQTFVTTLRELFNTSPLSQYMDQTNPLAEITHKRRLSSLGPGGVGRDQAGFAVREIHPSHFGRICPIETPEGQNAGLVGSLASYARISPHGFLLSPASEYQPSSVGVEFSVDRHSNSRVSPGTVRMSEKIHRALPSVYLLTAEAEDSIYLCTADIGESVRQKPRGDQQRMLLYVPAKPEPTGQQKTQSKKNGLVPLRYKQEFIPTSIKKIQYSGVCPVQMISVATSLIPFLEHDDANRALMGSNMQRQAVPLVFPEKPYVGTGLEIQTARDSSTTLLASNGGQITYVDARRIEVRQSGRVSVTGSSRSLKSPKLPFFPQGNPNFQSPHTSNTEGQSCSSPTTTYILQSYARSNQSTAMTHRPLVQVGEWVEKGDILADGAATHHGEVSLGKNILLAYMPWEGYNFEDAIVISEHFIVEDIYSSLHIEHLEMEVKHAGILNLRESQGFDRRSTETFFEGSPPVFEQDLTPHLEIGKEYLTKDFDILLNVPQPERPKGKRVEPAAGTSFRKEVEAFLTNATETEASQVSQLKPKPASYLCDLDSDGVILPGSWVKEGDILVGKVTLLQKTKTITAQAPAEYRLLGAIFSEDAPSFKSEGTSGFGRSERSGRTNGEMTESGKTVSSSPRFSLSPSLRFKNTSWKAGVGVEGRVIDCLVPWSVGSEVLNNGEFMTQAINTNVQTSSLSPLAAHSLSNRKSGNASKGLQPTESSPGQVKTEVKNGRSPNVASFSRTPGVKTLAGPFTVQIFLAHKKRIQLGDKMSGRHGNKGIVSLILPPQDMPFLQSGTPIDIVLNPLGVPSRMNVGQVLETLLGLVSVALHEIYRLMPFDEMYSGEEEDLGPKPGPSGQKRESFVQPETSRSLVYSKLQKVRDLLGPSASWMFDPNAPGKTQLFDGRTGEVFHQPVLVGYSYMFKLIHLVDDKIHARSTGPYSLVTQQPLGGRSKKGGQRLGEMEVWALEGFGAAYILQEFLTLKSDEIYSRNVFLLNLFKRKQKGKKETGRSTQDVDSHFCLFESGGERPGSLRPLEKTSPGNGLRPKQWAPNLFKIDSSAGRARSKERPLFSRSQDRSASLQKKSESRVPESFRVLVAELKSLCLDVYYSPDFRLSYPSLLAWNGLSMYTSKKDVGSLEVSTMKTL